MCIVYNIYFDRQRLITRLINLLPHRLQFIPRLLLPHIRNVGIMRCPVSASASAPATTHSTLIKTTYAFNPLFTFDAWRSSSDPPCPLSYLSSSCCACCFARSETFGFLRALLLSTSFYHKVRIWGVRFVSPNCVLGVGACAGLSASASASGHDYCGFG